MNLEERMRSFEDLWRRMSAGLDANPMFTGSEDGAPARQLSYRLVQKDEDARLVVAVPGYGPEDVVVEATDRTLTIRVPEHDILAFTLGGSFDRDKMAATCRNGQLVIQFPRAAAPTTAARRVPVTS